MATPLESTEKDEKQATPALLHDGDGVTTILPTERLPGVDFGAHLDPSGALDGATTGLKRTATNTASGDERPRTETENVKASKRPKIPARARTLLGTSTLVEPMHSADPMSSDTDSTSSDEEEAVSRKPKRPSLNRTQSAAEIRRRHEDHKQVKKGRSYSRFLIGNEHFRTQGKVSKRDGRLNISVNETANSGYLAKALGHTIKHHLDIPNRQRARKQRQHAADHPDRVDESDVHSIASSLPTHAARPRLNIVIMVIGSRGDIQPFLKIGNILREKYGHRVRIATHPTFREFVEKETDLEFFSVGGDPSELMAFMVKNPGLVPSLSTIKDGEIPRRRQAMGEMFEGMWRACTHPTDSEPDHQHTRTMRDSDSFIADAIIANPPSMAHVHIAERLGIPLHIMFTFPYSPTQAFPHPLANIRPGKSNVDASYVNFISYPLVEMMTWQGLGDIVNKFRRRILGLEPVSALWAPGALYRMKVPYTYMWSPSLVSKPNDWGPEIDVSGFVFMELANTFQPGKDLVDFLEAGEPPVYIGFGSIVVDDPNEFTDMIIEATRIAGVRALINKGWGGLGTSNENTPDNIFMLGNTPHDWLFPKCKAVVHHGGAGTTAIGLKCAKPTMIIPFFGDQPFWAARVAEAKAGAHEIIPWRKMTAEKLAEGIKQCLTEEAQRNVQRIADSIAREGDGALNACRSFHRSLPLAGTYNMRCSILEDRVAHWTLRGSSLRLSALAAELLIRRGTIKPADLKLFRVYTWNDFDGPGEPITGTVGAMTDWLWEMGGGVGMVPVRAAEHLKKRAEHERKKARVEQRKELRKSEKRQRKAVKAGGEEEKERETGPPSDGKGTSHAQRPSAERANTDQSVLSADPETPIATVLVRDFTSGVKRSGAAILTLPNDVHLAISQGLHNAPRLYGDATVRKPLRITGFRSGCAAGGHEFITDVYDAWTGVVTQPVGGFKDGDTVSAKLAGFGVGTAKGLGGFVLKNVAAIVAPSAYVTRGCIVYVKKRAAARDGGPGSKEGIRKAHLSRGMREYAALAHTDDLGRTQRSVVDGWNVYEALWTQARADYAPLRSGKGSSLVAQLRFGRERKKWTEAGALETAENAEKALRAKREGGLDDLLRRRRKEVAVAEEPRRTGMEGSDDDEDKHEGSEKSPSYEDEATLSDPGIEKLPTARRDGEARALAKVVTM